MLVSLYESLLRNQREHRRNQLPRHRQHRSRRLSRRRRSTSGPRPATQAGAIGAGSAGRRRASASIYANERAPGHGAQAIDLHVEAIPRRCAGGAGDGAASSPSDIVHAGDTVVVEATVRPWQQPARNVRIPVKLPARLAAGNLRILVSDAGTLDRSSGSAAAANSRGRVSKPCLPRRGRQHPPTVSM